MGRKWNPVPEVRNEVSKLNIRGQLNLIYAMSKLLAYILNLVQDNKVARDTLRKTAEGMLEQMTILYRDIGNYTAVSNTE